MTESKVHEHPGLPAAPDGYLFVAMNMRPPSDSNAFSRVVHRVDRGASRPAIAVVVAGLIVVFGIVLAIAGFPQTWQTAFASVCAAITTVMVFVIQHTQHRDQAAIQLKLDELIRALPEADDHFVQVEAAPDSELVERGQAHLEHHLAVRADE